VFWRRRIPPEALAKESMARCWNPHRLNQERLGECRRSLRRRSLKRRNLENTDNGEEGRQIKFFWEKTKRLDGR